MVHIDMVELVVGAASVGIIGFFAGLLWGIRRMNELLVDLYAAERTAAYYRSLIPERSKDGKFVKKEKGNA